MPRALTSLALISTVFSATMSGSAMAAETATVTADGKPAVKLTLPTGWSAVPSGAKTVLLPPGGAPHVQVWKLESKTIADAEKTIATLVVSEVTAFKSTTSTALTIAESPARQVVGTGLEADDGDPSNAEITVFTVSGKVFLLIAHGEGDGTKKRHDELATVLASAVTP